MRLARFKASRFLVNIALLSGIVGCSVKGCSSAKNIPPEEQLHSYISAALNVVSADQKQTLVDLTSGQLKQTLVNSTDEMFRKSYIEKRYDLKRFEIVERRDIVPDKEVQVDFKLVYRSWNSGELAERAPQIDTTNRATLVYEYGHWAISHVESLDSAMEWDVGLSLDDVSTKGVNENSPPVEIESSRDETSEMPVTAPPASEAAPAK